MFSVNGESRIGALDSSKVIDLTGRAVAGGAEIPKSLLDVIDAGESGLSRLRELAAVPSGAEFDLTAVRVLPPLYPPRGNVLAIGRNYEEHARESARARAGEVTRPTVFTKAQTSITGPFDDILVDRRVTSQVDWEVELGVVIGTSGRDIPRDRALEHVFGYTVVNDLSARDVQYGWGGQYFKGKSLDGFCPTGPWIVTADEIDDPQALTLRCRVNGVTKQEANTKDMIFAVHELIAQVSVGMTLPAGTLIATGTPAGVGFARQPPEFLQGGDVLESEVEGIGTLRNSITETG
jgi:2-keto-4-pentenoate hydratase/2-oxohepta-3-ene-1,7-dioic acid hydratase in catechol pathway